MTLRAAFFDVGDTLVEHWAPPEAMQALAREALRREFGERAWYERWISGDVRPPGNGPRGAISDAEEELLRQETVRWYEEWFRNAQVGIDDIDMDRLRAVMTLPLDLVSTPVRGAFAAVRWCKEKGLTVVLVTNTLTRGDEEAWIDWRRAGLDDAIDAIVTSHSVGWQKPHRRIFERALEVAQVAPAEAVMVGDRLDADVWGASRLGIRTVLRRTTHEQPKLDVTPDAVIDDLTELPSVLRAWLDVPTAHGRLRRERAERR